jgi:hypothetical protein
LQRYTFLAICGLATKEQDDDARGTFTTVADDPVTPEHVAELETLIKETGTDEGKLLAYAKAPILDALTQRQYADVKALLVKKKTK